MPVDFERKIEGAACGDDTQVLIEDQEGLADRIHDRLGERAPIVDIHEWLTVGRGQCVCQEWALQQVLRFHVYSPKKAPQTRSALQAVGYQRLPQLRPKFASPAAAATNEPDDQQQDQRADGGVDDRRDDAGAEMDAELRKQPAADEGADDSNEEIADDPEPGALHDLAGQPARNEADHQYDQETFTRHVHLRILQIRRIAGQSAAKPRTRRSRRQ